MKVITNNSSFFRSFTGLTPASFCLAEACRFDERVGVAVLSPVELMILLSIINLLCDSPHVWLLDGLLLVFFAYFTAVRRCIPQRILCFSFRRMSCLTRRRRSTKIMVLPFQQRLKFRCSRNGFVILLNLLFLK